MLKIQIGVLEFEVTTRERTTSVKVTQHKNSFKETVVGGESRATSETKAALKAILAYIS